MAKQHFIYSKDGSGCAAMLVELHEQRGYSNEIDLFIAQAVLQYVFKVVFNTLGFSFGTNFIYIFQISLFTK